MAELHLKHLYKVYPNGTKAVNDFNMDIDDKEFIVFVGPSGCGKSTTLRMIAGLEEISAGELYIGDDLVNDIQPKDRDIAMVFQNYALYPHMTVYKNMAFGLRLRKMRLEEIDKRVREAAEILGITEYLDRKPAQMSGGQRQRVALGRAIVREPRVFLLDEPLSNLDAKLRTQMRSEISKIHKKINTTFIYVTHDQVEAMTMGTRIVVMKDGFVQQIDTPTNLYQYPCNKFVAGFIGSPQMNFFEGTMHLDGGNVTIKLDNTSTVLEAPYEYFVKADKEFLDGQRPLWLGIRSEHVSVDMNRYAFKAKCRVSYTEELGTECLVYADMNTDVEESITESPTRIIIKAPAGTVYENGDVIDISLDLTHLNVFDKQTEINIAPRVPAAAKIQGEVKSDKLSVFGTQIDLPSAFKADDGVYEVVIPTDSVSLGGNINARIFSEEKIVGETLTVFKAGNNYLFASGLSVGNAKEVTLGLDLKRLTLTNENGAVYKPIPEYSPVECKLIREKQVCEEEKNGKVKKVKKFAYKFAAAGMDIPCPTALAERLLANDAKTLLKSELELRISPDGVSAGINGIPADVESILDYGDEKFAKCKVGDTAIVVKVNADFSDEQTHLEIDTDKISLIEQLRDIRLI